MTSNVHQDLLYQGYMGRIMNQVIYHPDLNIIDAIWFSPVYPNGPAALFSKPVRAFVLLAGTDPVAQDCPGP